MHFRIGYGCDYHRFDPCQKLKLGGLFIPDTPGLAGYSDADVLTHAVIDAVLGALGLGDIGNWFPPGEPEWKDADSGDLLRTVLANPEVGGWNVGNVDTTIVCQQPKLTPHIRGIRNSLSRILDVELQRVSVKATTTEGMGWAGRGEGMAAHAVVLMQSAD
ncbi:MAG: 2-C-methyl-D-erythritol 2,4-cyclodiphosphate synthase [Lentisphaeria bacterium]